MSLDNAVSTKHFTVNWNNHMNHVRKAFDNLLNSDELTDVTLYAEGKKIRAHKVILSACSSFFKDIFREVSVDYPVIVLKDVEYAILMEVLKFVYNGEVSIESKIFEGFIATAEYLKISGLTDSKNSTTTEENETETEPRPPQPDDKHKPESKKRTKSSPKRNGHKRVKENYDTVKCEEVTELGDMFDSQLVEPCDLPSSLDFNPPSPAEESPTIDNVMNSVLDRNQTQNTYECEICGKRYRLKDSLYKHFSVHSGNTTCTICSKVLSRKTHLDRHMMVTHGVKLNVVKNNTSLVDPP